MKTRVTQLDIARVAGVHNTTVSLSLRNCPAIPVSTRERIRSIAVKLGYYPDPALQALAAYRTGRSPTRRQETIAYVTHAETRWGWRAMPAREQCYAGAVRQAVERGYGLEHFWLGEPGMSGRRLSDMLFHRGIVGVLLASHPLAAHAVAEMDWARFCAVRIDRHTHVPSLHYVTNDQTGMMRTAMRQARAAGYRRIGLVMPTAWDEAAYQAWSAGFLTEQARMPANDRIPMLCYAKGMLAATGAGSSDVAVDLPSFETWFGRHRPEVILSHAPFVQACFERVGLAVPRDVAFVDLFLDAPDGRVAGIQQPCARVGETAVELLVAHLQRHEVGLPAVPMATLLEGTWVNGDSLPTRQIATRAAAEHCVADSAA